MRMEEWNPFFRCGDDSDWDSRSSKIRLPALEILVLDFEHLIFRNDPDINVSRHLEDDASFLADLSQTGLFIQKFKTPLGLRKIEIRGG